MRARLGDQPHRSRTCLLRVPYQLVAGYRRSATTASGWGLNRGRRDFSDDELERLALAVPHLVRLLAATEREQAVSALVDAGTRTGAPAATAVVSVTGLVLASTPEARGVLELAGVCEDPALRQPQLVGWRMPARSHAAAEVAVGSEATSVLVRVVQELVTGQLLIALFPETRAHGRELTERQLDVLRAVARGLTSAAVAHRLGINERTVHRHLDETYRVLGVRTRVSAVLAARERGLLDLAQLSLVPAPRSRSR